MNGTTTIPYWASHWTGPDRLSQFLLPSLQELYLLVGIGSWGFLDII